MHLHTHSYTFILLHNPSYSFIHIHTPPYSFVLLHIPSYPFILLHIPSYSSMHFILLHILSYPFIYLNILSYTFILLHILPECVNNCSISMFADDTAIYFSSNNTVEIEDRLNSDLASISNWIQANSLGLNVHKTEYMVIGSHQKLKISQPIDLRLNDTPIARVKSYKYLGVTIDTNLSWSTHTDVLSNKVSSRIGLLRRVRPYLTNFTATLVYNATIVHCSTTAMFTGTAAALQRRQSYKDCKIG